MFKVRNKNNDAILISLLLTLNIFHTFSSVATVNFEQVNVCWIRDSSAKFHLPYMKVIFELMANT